MFESHLSDVNFFVLGAVSVGSVSVTCMSYGGVNRFPNRAIRRMILGKAKKTRNCEN